LVDYSNSITEPTVSVTRYSILNKKVEVGKNIEVLYSGIATLSDKVFKVTEDNGKFYATLDGQKFEVEKGIVVPYLKLTKIKTSVLLKTDYMIYPYDANKKIIPEGILIKNFPLVHAYLLKNKTKLNQRDKGKTSKYDSWYAYGRKQGLNVINAKKIVIIPGMIGGDCVPREVDITSVMASFNTMVFTSGYISPRGQETDIACDIVLSQEFLDFVKTVGKPWPGSGESYYSLTSKQVKSFSR